MKASHTHDTDHIMIEILIHCNDSGNHASQ